jgi:hypothetical protein
MRVYKNRNDVPDDKTELVSKSDMIKRLEDIHILIAGGNVSSMMDRLLDDLKK